MTALGIPSTTEIEQATLDLLTKIETQARNLGQELGKIADVTDLADTRRILVYQRLMGRDVVVVWDGPGAGKLLARGRATRVRVPVLRQPYSGQVGSTVAFDQIMYHLVPHPLAPDELMAWSCAPPPMRDTPTLECQAG